MTKLLEKAFAEASKLSDAEQNALAGLWLDELASEERWHNAFERSQDPLKRLADEALSEHHAGHSQSLDPDTL